jgi:electron transfer flavoprotein alpha subunit
MTVLVIAEHNNQQLNLATRSTITAAIQIQAPITVLIAGFQCDPVVTEVSRIAGVDNVWVADAAAYQHALAETIAPLILHCANEMTHILAPATTFGKNILPRVAAKLNVAQISDVIAITPDGQYQRPIYAGSAIATVQSDDPVKVLTIRTTAFSPAVGEGKTATVTKIDFSFENKQSRFVNQELHQSDRPTLSAAEVVISGGRGLQSKENFLRLMKIADHLGAAVGASRAAVDAGMAPNDCQVGQTGQAVAPKLYIAVGISGAIQHLAGMKDSRLIIAINKDPEAPIFQIADYGLVADINDILTQWEHLLFQK